MFLPGTPVHTNTDTDFLSHHCKTYSIYQYNHIRLSSVVVSLKMHSFCVYSLDFPFNFGPDGASGSS